MAEQQETSNNNELEMGKIDMGKPIKIIQIIGQIEGHSIVPSQTKATKYEHIIPMLLEVEQDEKAKGILIVMNTMGGDVEAGLAISELIRGMKKPSVSLVLGGGHSIGVPLAVSADYTFIAPTATMTVHPLRSNGLFITARQSFAYFTKMQERIIQFVCSNSKIQEDAFRELMNNPNMLADDIGTVLIGKQAVDAGLVDAVGGIHDALEKLESML